MSFSSESGTEFKSYASSRSCWVSWEDKGRWKSSWHSREGSKEGWFPRRPWQRSVKDLLQGPRRICYCYDWSALHQCRCSAALPSRCPYLPPCRHGRAQWRNWSENVRGVRQIYWILNLEQKFSLQTFKMIISVLKLLYPVQFSPLSYVACYVLARVVTSSRFWFIKINISINLIAIKVSPWWN